MAVEAVHRDVQLTSNEPLRVRRVPLEHLVPPARPLQFIREFRPEGKGIALGLRVDLFVLNPGSVAECGWRRKTAIFVKKVVEIGVHAGRIAQISRLKA
jgi:hypothetical protein